MRPVLLSLLLITIVPAWAIDSDLDGVVDPVDPAPNDITITGYQKPWLYTFVGDTPWFDEFGAAVSAAGDVNDDGHADMVIGAPFALDEPGIHDSSTPGGVRVINGRTGTVLYTLFGDDHCDYFGVSVSDAGDVNHDGHADVIVGASGSNHIAGCARVISGIDGSVLYTFYGNNTGDSFGVSVSGAGDVNQDGYSDMIVGAPSDDHNGTDAGSARIFSGKDGSVLYVFFGDAPGDGLGGSVSGAADINNDGHADVIVGIDDWNNMTGMVRVMSGIDGSVLYSFYGDSSGDRFGYTASSAGDVNNDGHADVIIGTYPALNGNSIPGTARVFSGADGSVLYTFSGDSAGDFFGKSVSDAGDIDRDGYDDMIVGAIGDDNTVTNAGSARVFSGKDGRILHTFNGEKASIVSTGFNFGASVSGTGDINGDGYPDLIVGADSAGYARVFSGAMLLQQTTDSDGDGLIDTLDSDDDADGTPDVSDLFPQDTDNDGISNNNDLDDDNDGIPDYIDADPFNSSNTNERMLPLDAPFKGTLLHENQGVPLLQ